MNYKPITSYNQYKVRKISYNIVGPIYGMTIPRKIAAQFMNIKFNIVVQEDKIIFQSGLDIAHLKEVIYEDAIQKRI